MAHPQTAVPVAPPAVDAFRADGVVLLDGLLDADVVTRLRRICARARPVGEGFWSESNVWRRDPSLREVLADARVGGTLAALLGSTQVWLFEETLLVKEAGSSTPTPWHQDLVHYPLSGSMVATLWVSLDAVAPDGGRVTYVRGSHRWGRRFASVGFTSGETITAPGVDPVPQDVLDGGSRAVVSFPTRPGDCIVHHGLTLHGAPGNASRSARRALAVSVFGDDVTYAPAALPISHPAEPELRAGHTLGELFPRLWPEATWPA